MKATSMFQIAEWCGGALIQGVPSDTASSLSTDTRSIEDGEVFLALKGDNFDAHDFLEKAKEANASALIVQSLPLITQSFPGGIIHVRNTLTALQNLAAAYRRSLKDFFAVGVTGSNGKTSTKDFLRSVLGQAEEVNATRGNLNNHIGLPLTILRTEEQHRVGVWEMGMNHPGEIEVLAEIAQPNAAVITNIGTAHIEFMKTRDAIAEEKLELAMAVNPDGFAVIPESDDYFSFAKDRVRCELIPVGIESGEVTAHDLQVAADGRVSFQLSGFGGEKVPVTLPVSGRHMVTNALLAAAVGFKSGMDTAGIARGLEEVTLTGGRLQPRTAGGLQFLDDSYNANPDSMRAAIDTLMGTQCEGKRIAIFGMMGELGEREVEAHRELGAYAAGSGLDLLLTVGETAALIAEGAGDGMPVKTFEKHDDVAGFLKDKAESGDLILVKGSRSTRMEKVIEAVNTES